MNAIDYGGKIIYIRPLLVVIRQARANSISGSSEIHPQVLASRQYFEQADLLIYGTNI